MGRRTATLQAGWLLSQMPAAVRFRRAAKDVERAQHRRLEALLSVLSGGALGRELGLERISGPDAFQRHVPVGDYLSHASFIDRVAAGEERVMSAEPVEILERTGGSGGATKLIPYTARLRREFAEAVAVWMIDLHRSLPGLLGTRSYWSVSRAVRQAERTSGGVRVGFDDDAEYFGPLSRWALGRMMAVPGEVARSSTLEEWRLRTAVAMVECHDLGLISVWSPSFLTRLLEEIERRPDALLRRLTPGARRRLAQACKTGPLDGTVLWPRLQVVSAWGDGFAAGLVGPMMRRLTSAHFQPKGLLATEGVVSFPLWSEDGGVMAVTSHVIELRDVQDGHVVWAHEARLGGRYQPILTTGGGLVRYALPDVVEVVGFTGRVPRVRLVGRTDKASDMVGEKLTEAIVQEALGRVARSGFAMLAPLRVTQRYALFVDDRAPEPAMVERALRRAHHYAYARDLEQLGPVEVHVVPDAWRRWERAVEACGLVLGDQKPGALEVREQVIEALLTR